MQKRFLSVFKYILFLCFGLFLAWWQFDKMTPLQRSQFGESLQYANYWLLIPIIILVLLGHVSRAIRWKILIEPMGYKPSTTITFYAVMSGYLGNTFVPRAGELLKCTLLSRAERIPFNKLIGTILVEKALDLVCYIIFILITILIQITHVSSFVKQKISAMPANESGLPAWLKFIIIIAIILIFIFFIKWLLKKFAHHRYIISLKGFHIGLKEGISAIARLKNKGWFIFHTIFIWAMYLLQVYIGFSALSATAHLGMVEACSVLSLATLGMIVSPGGIGAFPLAVQEVLLIYHVDNVSFGWLIWGVSTAIVLIGGLISIGLLVYKKKIQHETEQTTIAENI